MSRDDVDELERQLEEARRLFNQLDALSVRVHIAADNAIRLMSGRVANERQ